MKMRRWAIGGLGAAATLLAAAATAWACVSGPSANLSTVNAKPGQEVQATMRDFRKADPIVVRWNDLNGQVVGTFENKGGSQGTPFTETIAVPADAKPGNYVLIFTQHSPDGKLSQMPVRALVTVTSPDGATPVLGAPVGAAPVDRPARLVTADDSVGAGTLVLVALGVAGVGMFVAGIAALLAGRRSRAPEAVRAGS